MTVPRLLVSGDPRHGVVHYAADLRDAVAVAEPAARPARGGPAHVHFTDRLFGDSPPAAAEAFTDLARRSPLTVTLHDLPQESDGRHHEARRRCYAAVAAASRGVVCNSRHELTLLRRCTDERVLPPTTVIPLPVGPLRPVPEGAPGPRASRPDVAVLGFFYPGKGHADVADALRVLRGSTGAEATLTVLGGPSAGHEAELDDLVRRTREDGVAVEVTGYLPEADLLRRSRAAAVPVVAHRHVSASGSLNSWITAGRRPLVRAGGYASEMAELRPGTLTVYEPTGLAEAVAAALAEPATTWLAPDAVLSPGLAEVAAAYLRWWREGPSW
jgi:glycosyltransferase involved in cell wall biosynthesis